MGAGSAFHTDDIIVGLKCLYTHSPKRHCRECAKMMKIPGPFLRSGRFAINARMSSHDVGGRLVVGN